MNNFESYRRELSTAKAAKAFDIQGQAFNDFRHDVLTFEEYTEIYWMCEKIMGPCCNAL